MIALTQRRFGGALFMPMLVMIWQRLSAQTPGDCSPGYCTAGNAANGYAIATTPQSASGRMKHFAYMIIARIIEKVEVRAKRKIHIKFRISLDQFFGKSD